MSNAVVPNVYSWIITDVISKAGEHFANIGVHEQVLRDLERIWEAKIMASHVASFPQIVESLPLQQQQQQHQSQHFPQQHQILPGVATLTAGPGWEGQGSDHGTSSYPIRYQIQQNDGCSKDVFTEPPQLPPSPSIQSKECSATLSPTPNLSKKLDEQIFRAWELKANGNVARRSSATKAGRQYIGCPLLNSSERVNQNDGNDDDEDEDDEDEHNEEGINSDLDDEADEDEDQEVDDIILCQYEKVTRNKNKWKCTLRDGIVKVNGKDYLFSKASGEFEW